MAEFNNKSALLAIAPLYKDKTAQPAEQGMHK